MSDISKMIQASHGKGKLPFDVSKIESVSEDPIKTPDGHIWYNTTEGVYKGKAAGAIEVFLTSSNLYDLVFNADREARTFNISFNEILTLYVRHNRATTKFVYSIYDSELGQTIPATASILDENELKIDFVDPVTGNIFIAFEV